eukprot:1162126-Amphidinium_carterae.1
MGVLDMPSRPILGLVHYLAAQLQARAVPAQTALSVGEWTETETHLIEQLRVHSDRSLSSI